MICPHCGIGVNINWNEVTVPLRKQMSLCIKGYILEYGFCPQCEGFILYVSDGDNYDGLSESFIHIENKELIFPKICKPRNLSNVIPEKYVSIFNEAELVLSISPRSSATLSRYLLQSIFHEELGIRKRDLEQEIEELSTRNSVPTTLCSMLQVMRKVANFAAHPKKSTNSNEIIDVVTGEAEIMLDLIYEVFDYVFIKPNQHKEFLKTAKERYGIEV